MKNLSILIAIAMMAFVSAGIMSCGDDNTTTYVPGSANNYWPRTVHITMTAYGLTTVEKDSEMLVLTEFFKQKAGSMATVVNDGRIVFSIPDTANYINLKKLLKSLSDSKTEIDAAAQKVSGISTFALSMDMGNETVVDYTFEPRVALVGTWSNDVDSVSLVVTSTPYKTVKGENTGTYEATLTYKKQVIYGHFNNSGFDAGFEANTSVPTDKTTSGKGYDCLDGMFSYDTKTFTATICIYDASPIFKKEIVLTKK